MLIVTKTNPNVTVTLNIGLATSLNWGGYKSQEANHGKVQTLVDVLDAPHRIAPLAPVVHSLGRCGTGWRLASGR